MEWLDNTLDVLHDKRIIKMRPSHWKARFIVSIILLVLSTAGIFITDLAPNFAWRYWCTMVPIFALLCIWLSWRVSRSSNLEGAVIWHEVLHWVGMLGAVYIVSILVSNGVISYLIGALFILILLSLTMFLAGVHFDSMFIIIGVLLGLMAIASVYFVKYLTVVIIPIVIIIALLLLWRFMTKSKSEVKS